MYRENAPNIPSQALFRTFSGMSYSLKERKDIQFFIRLLAETGLDIARIFDANNVKEDVWEVSQYFINNDIIAQVAYSWPEDTEDYPLSDMIDFFTYFYDKGIRDFCIKNMWGGGKEWENIPSVGDYTIPETPKSLEILQFLKTFSDTFPGAQLNIHMHDTADLGGPLYDLLEAHGIPFIRDANLKPMSGGPAHPSFE
ncbi:MAG: hypothetical protein HRT90_08825, partial [Candidatus Margulisbacteria bacterium]|nr:hypothetical protein [Candidatus Margulisiibacteriota bacterium]